MPRYYFEHSSSPSKVQEKATEINAEMNHTADLSNLNSPSITCFTAGDMQTCPIPFPPVILSPENGQTIDKARPYIHGTGQPGSSIQVCIDQICVTTEVDSSGRFLVQAPAALSEGHHLLTAIQSNYCGNVSRETALTFMIKF